MKKLLLPGLSFGILFGAIIMVVLLPGVFLKKLEIGEYFLIVLFIVIFGGTLFGLLTGIFTLVQRNKFKKIKEALSREETIILDDAANHFVGKEGVGGWLFLSLDKLIFISHNFNFQNHELVINNSDITSVLPSRNLLFFPALIVVHNGVEERFAIYTPKKWEMMINTILENKELV